MSKASAIQTASLALKSRLCKPTSFCRRVLKGVSQPSADKRGATILPLAARYPKPECTVLKGKRTPNQKCLQNDKPIPYPSAGRNTKGFVLSLFSVLSCGQASYDKEINCSSFSKLLSKKTFKTHGCPLHSQGVGLGRFRFSPCGALGWPGKGSVCTVGWWPPLTAKHVNEK